MLDSSIKSMLAEHSQISTYLAPTMYRPVIFTINNSEYYSTDHPQLFAVADEISNPCNI